MRGRNKRGKKRGSGKERQRLKRKGQVESREWNGRMKKGIESKP